MCALAGCGFHLRGTADLPFDTVYVPNATSGIALDLARNLRAGSNVKLVNDAKAAEAILEFSGETRAKEHERCGSHLVGPLLATATAGNIIASHAPARYRPAARHAQPVDTSTSHVGFRCVVRTHKDA